MDMSKHVTRDLSDKLSHKEITRGLSAEVTSSDYKNPL